MSFCPICSSMNSKSNGYLSPDSLSSVILNVSRKNVQAQAKIQTLLSQVTDSDVKNQIESIFKNLGDSSSELSSLQQLFQKICLDHNQHVRNIETNSQKLQDELSKNKDKIKSLKKQSQDAKTLKSDNETLKLENQDLQSKLSIKEQECNALASQIIKDRKKIKQIKKDQEKYSQDRSQQMIDDLTDEVKQLKERVQCFTSENKKLQENNDELNLIITKNDGQISMLKKMIESKSSPLKSPPRNQPQENPEPMNSNLLKNPFTGEFGVRFDKIQLMTHFEPYQRVQLILNEASREFKILNDANDKLKEQIDEIKENHNQELEKYQEKEAVLNHLLSKLNKIAENERLFAKFNLDSDSAFLKFIKKNIDANQVIYNSDQLVSDLIKNDSVACTLVSSLMLTNAKQNEQIARLFNQAAMREKLLDDIRNGGIPPERVVQTVKDLKNENKSYKSNLKTLQDEIANLNRSIDFYDEANNKINRLQDDLNKSQQILLNAETDLAEKSTKVGILSSKNADLNEEITRLKRQVSDKVRENAELKAALKDMKYKSQKSHDSDSNKIYDMKRLLSESLTKLESMKQENKRLSERVAKSHNATLASDREKQRIMNIVAREIGAPYNVNFFEPDDEHIFVSFIRRIRDDLKKLRIFQSTNPAY
ncbi:hypothetical protein TVAG_059620 [Trichomonas vaginalis G3]|uniref:Uncharacterized protein n=1 Tax=Trichomonas vaginalis (strain ATCC PRA-98 / G3) TaxID=412133 RepID=A2FB14_TRIV3|nr:zipper putative tumor suppressor 2 homolog-like protein-related family [Trichomonas vaginalis G3]EAX97897.1 hypothetical protein TVAG_059620 [Trichomonas vaginalis G3]KAI5509848.1 zipper putative tumor suppressor 2 homolog-like protein-related family [Trichomonas vaginalis G3]|eukprot:XP_001310827.1 hypothetical protein [Trichomonas vaginalis G3]